MDQTYDKLTMKKSLLLLTGFLLLATGSFAQTAGYTYIDIYYYDFVAGRGIDNADAHVQNVTVGNGSKQCFKAYSDSKTYDALIANDYLVTNGTVQLTLTTHRDFCGASCSVDCTKDNEHGELATQPVKILIKDYIPGVTHYIPFKVGTHTLRFKFNYRVPVPERPGFTTPDFLCIDNNFEITSSIKHIKPTSSNVKLTWQYHIPGDRTALPCNGSCNPMDYCNGQSTCVTNGKPGCFDPDVNHCFPVNMPTCCDNPQYEDVWNSLGTTVYKDGTNSLVFNPKNYSKIANYVRNGSKSIEFRVAAYDGVNLVYSAKSAFSVSPSAPTVSNIQKVKACSGQPDGEISFKVNGTVNNYNWYILKNIADCSQDEILSGNCDVSSTVAYGNTTGGNVTATDIFAGTYILVVQNWGNNTNNNGGCYRTYSNITVGTVPDLVINTPTKEDLTCYESNDGAITVKGSGGDTGTIRYGLNLSGKPTDWQSTATFQNLPAGEYVTSIKDRCKVLTKNITLLQPDAPISATAGHVVPLCHGSGDGSITITPTGGYGDYAVTLLKGGDVVKQYNIYSDGEAVVYSDLSYGTYTYTVQDIAGNCDIVSDDITLPEPPVISLSVQSVLPVTCPEAWPDDGQVTFDIQNAAFPYTVTMTHSETGQTFTSNTNIVSSLPEGSYYVGIGYNNGCPDTYTLLQQVEITKPEPIIIELTRDDMTCTGSFDASISATIAGGNLGGYTYRWQTETGGQWVDFNDPERQDGLNLKNLYDGIYRLYVADSKGCEKASASVTIVNPDPLVIDEVILTGLECKEEENGNILPAVTGGWGSYIYEYQKLPDTNWYTFELSDAFDQGTYRVRVTDREGCLTEWQDDLVFAEADEALELTGLEIKDYNGYNISCYGLMDGEVTINVKGGLTSQALGYEYAVDNEPFTTTNPITGLAAGNHTFHVRDNNGCIKSQSIDLIEPTQLDVSVNDIKHVQCFGDSSGYIQVAGTGGVSPYTFSINEATDITDSLFTKLTSGTYSLVVQDQNTCKDTVETAINDLFPPIEFEWTVDSVTCYNYSDGAVKVDILGGSVPYDLRWLHDSEIRNTQLEELKDGWYYLQVEDNEGCMAFDSVYVPEPINIDAGPDLNLCYEQTAILDASWSISEATYVWRNDLGQISNEAAIEINKGGTYYAEVSRADRECVMRDTVKIDAYDIRFEAKFLAATDLVLGDTLQLVETSSPTPDSLHWYFDDRATVLNYSPTIPELMFDQEGTYSVRFEAYYGPCTDSLTKIITVYMPENVPDSLDHVLFGETGFKDVRIYPNPSDGVFTLSVELHQKDALGVVIVSSGGMEEFRDSYEASESFEISFDLTSKIAGVYVMKLVTGSDQMSIRMVIE